jgi:RNA polymerase sigma-70 factor (ECF subfamily)
LSTIYLKVNQKGLYFVFIFEVMENERELIERVKRGEKGAFEKLVTLYREDLLRMAYKLTGNSDDAKDLAQEALWRLYKSMERIDNSKSLRFWLHKVISNLAIDSWRKSKREVPLVEDLIVSINSKDKLLLKLDECMKKLPLKQKTVLVLFYTEGYRVKEIAEILDCAEGTVKAHLFKGRENLKNCLGKIYEV